MSGFDEEKLTSYLDSLPDTGIPSVDCIVFQNHKQIFRHMNSTSDAAKKKKVQADQRYLMYSMTKVQTMTAAMQLMEQGKLSLDDEVGTYLPAYRKLYVQDETGLRESSVPMKIRHLLSMQSGLDYDLQRPGILRVLKEKGQKASTRELTDAFVQTPLLFEPGSHFLYSLSHDVAAALIEAVSGMSFGEYLKKNLWEVLKLRDTFFAKPDNSGLNHLAQLYLQSGEGIVPMEPVCAYQLSEQYESGGAGLISCTEDYAKLADALACGGVSVDGVRILKPETVEVMKTNLLGDASLKDFRTDLGREGYGYGCGVQILTDPDEIGSPAPAGVFGWDGAAGSCIQMDTASKMSFVYCQHVINCDRAYHVIHPTLRDIIFGG